MISILDSLKQTYKSAGFVLKYVSLYFGFGFIGFCFLSFVLFDLSLFGDFFESTQLKIYFRGLLSVLSRAFLLFLIPFYAYKYNEGREISAFWDFIRENIFPIYLNNFKAYCIILLYILLLIIPGFYKYIRFFFVTQTTMFDEHYKEGRMSALKASSHLSKGSFFVIFFCFIFSSIILFSPSLLQPEKISFLPENLKNIFIVTLQFYVDCLVMLFITQFYFVLKRKSTDISP